MKDKRNDTFELYDLTVVVEAIEGHCTCNMEVGDQFFVQGGKVSLPNDTSSLPLRNASDHSALACSAAPKRAG